MQLLVSVRNASEAQIAADAGADIVDVKEPNAGPLGFAGAQTVRLIQQAVAGQVPVSAALGECVDWLRAGQSASGELTPVLQDLHFVKLGLADMRSSASSADGSAEIHSHWIDDWRSVRNQLLPLSSKPSMPQWVAVAYADYERAAAPAVQDILNAAIQAGCSTLLIDTFCKDGSGTLHWLSQQQLQQLRVQTHRHNLRLALAGQLTAAHLPMIQAIQPDIFAVRGAVCEGADRTATVSAAKVRELKAMLSG